LLRLQLIFTDVPCLQSATRQQCELGQVNVLAHFFNNLSSGIHCVKGAERSSRGDLPQMR
jgi:hypothetical protein